MSKRQNGELLSRRRRLPSWRAPGGLLMPMPCVIPHCVACASHINFAGAPARPSSPTTRIPDASGLRLPAMPPDAPSEGPPALPPGALLLTVADGDLLVGGGSGGGAPAPLMAGLPPGTAARAEEGGALVLGLSLPEGERRTAQADFPLGHVGAGGRELCFWRGRASALGNSKVERCRRRRRSRRADLRRPLLSSPGPSAVAALLSRGISSAERLLHRHRCIRVQFAAHCFACMRI